MLNIIFLIMVLLDIMVLCSSVSVKGEIPCIHKVIMVVNPNIAIKENE